VYRKLQLTASSYNLCVAYKAHKYQLISTHFSFCSEWLLFKATAIVLTASDDIPVKLSNEWIM